MVKVRQMVCRITLALLCEGGLMKFGLRPSGCFIAGVLGVIIVGSMFWVVIVDCSLFARQDNRQELIDLSTGAKRIFAKLAKCLGQYYDAT